jgi:hypothetical protein
MEGCSIGLAVNHGSRLEQSSAINIVLEYPLASKEKHFYKI